MKRRGKLYYFISFIVMTLSMKIIFMFHSNWAAIVLAIMINALFNIVWMSFMNNKKS